METLGEGFVCRVVPSVLVAISPGVAYVAEGVRDFVVGSSYVLAHELCFRSGDLHGNFPSYRPHWEVVR